MKPVFVIPLLAVLCGLPIQAQSTTNGKARATGACSVAHSGNGDTYIIKNCGIGEAQGKKIIDLLQEVLKGNDPTSTNDKLDELIKIAHQGLGRRLSVEQKTTISNFLKTTNSSGFAGISFNSGDRDSTVYANDFKVLFAQNRWPVDGNITMGTTAPDFGCFVDISPADKAAPPPNAMPLLLILKSSGIECKGRLSGMMGQGYYGITIGLKPVTE